MITSPTASNTIAGAAGIAGVAGERQRIRPTLLVKSNTVSNLTSLQASPLQEEWESPRSHTNTLRTIKSGSYYSGRSLTRSLSERKLAVDTKVENNTGFLFRRKSSVQPVSPLPEYKKQSSVRSSLQKLGDTVFSHVGVKPEDPGEDPEVIYQKKLEKLRQNIVDINHKSKKKIEYQVMICIMFVLVEVLDLIIDFANYLSFSLESSDSTAVYGYIYSFAMLLSIGSSIYMIHTNVRNLIRWKKHYVHGIQSKSHVIVEKRKAGRQRNSLRVYPRVSKASQYSADTARTTEFMMNAPQTIEAQEDNIELFLETCDINMNYYKALLISAVLEDFTMLLLAMGRKFFMTSYLNLEISYSTCLIAVTSIGEFLHCNHVYSTISLTYVQLLVSLAFFVFKMSYYRDMKRVKVQVELKKKDLEELLLSEHSVLDDFEAVPSSEVSKVVSVRHLLGSSVLQHFPLHVVGDVNILRYVRDCGNDEFAAYKKMKQMLKWRTERNMKAVYEKVMVKDLSNDEFRVCSRNVFPVVGEDGRHNVLSLCHLEKMSDELDEEAFEDIALMQLERRHVVLDYVSRKYRELKHNSVVVNLTRVENTSEVLDMLKHLSRVPSMIKRYYTYSTDAVYLYHAEEMRNLAETMVEFVRTQVPNDGDFLELKSQVVHVHNTNDWQQHQINVEQLPAELQGTRQEMLTHPLTDLLGDFNVLQLFTDVTDLEVTAVVQLKQQLVASLVDLSAQPEDIVNDVALLRYTRHHKLDVGSTATFVKKMLDWRSTHRLADIRSYLETHCELDFVKIPKYEELIKCFPRNFFLGETSDRSSVVRVDFPFALDWSLLLQSFNAEQFKTINIYIYELQNIIANRLSYQRRQIVSYLGLASAKALRFNQKSIYMKILQELNALYPITEQLYIVGHTSDQQITKYLGDENKVYRVNNEKRMQYKLLATIPSTLLPVTMGGENFTEIDDGKLDFDCVTVPSYKEVLEGVLHAKPYAV